MGHHAVIMAGGGGTRLWPLSRRKRPKQVLRLFGERTMFQLAVDRLLPMMPAEQVYVVALEEQAGELRLQAPEIPGGNYLLEPCPRGTASVIGLAAIHLRRSDPQAVMACLTADHYIADVEGFRELLRSAYALAERGELVTLGITPTYPATGFGYIQSGQALGEFEGHTGYRVKAFKEKPDAEEAERYLASGKYSWNSGMFVWKADAILGEIGRLMPDLAAGLQEIEAAIGTPRARRVLEDVWQNLEKQTIDYGVMEKAEHVAVIPADSLGWWDLGSWDRLFEIERPDANGNLIYGERLRPVETKGCLVYLDPQPGATRLIATLGIEDLIIVDTGDVLLVCKRGRSEEIRRLVEGLSAESQDQYL